MQYKTWVKKFKRENKDLVENNTHGDVMYAIIRALNKLQITKTDQLLILDNMSKEEYNAYKNKKGKPHLDVELILISSYILKLYKLYKNIEHFPLKKCLEAPRPELGGLSHLDKMKEGSEGLDYVVKYWYGFFYGSGYY